jgi:predicted nuclease with RNAse H fold
VEYVSTVGLDLSGPAGPENTGVAVFRVGQEKLSFTQAECDGSDAGILDLFARLADSGPVLAGIDAPLSYEPGGGFRERDYGLREELMVNGHNLNRVIPPLAQRMVYLTLRGYGVSRLLSTLKTRRIELVEVHPTASLSLRNAPLDDVGLVETSEDSRRAVQGWFDQQGVTSLSFQEGCTSHFVAACAAALAAWRWARGEAVWKRGPEPPFHPYWFVC